MGFAAQLPVTGYFIAIYARILAVGIVEVAVTWILMVACEDDVRTSISVSEDDGKHLGQGYQRKNHQRRSILRVLCLSH